MTAGDQRSHDVEFRPSKGGERAGLYVHVPFCSAICPYCDFAVARTRPGDRERFVEALIDETRRLAPHVGEGVVFDTIYLGGGTPSALDGAQLARVLEELADLLPLAPDVHVTLEANPEDVGRSAALAWQACGISAVSLGLQSLDEGELRFLGRRHDAREGIEALHTLLEVGFQWVSADLIYALPSSDRDAWVERLDRLPEGLPHLSCYELTVHEGTPFARFERSGRLVQVANAGKADWFRTVHEALESRGFEHYEVSNFARPGRRSRHNPKYWTGVPYLGLGPSAHSFDGRRRWSNEPDWRLWSESAARGSSTVTMLEELDAGARCLEQLMLRMRTSEGLDLDELAASTGHDPRLERRAALRQRLAEGALILEDSRLRPTLEGLLIAERLAIELS